MTGAQALASGYPNYLACAGAAAVGVAFSATRFITNGWIINFDAVVNHLRGSLSENPITERTVQRALALSIAYPR